MSGSLVVPAKTPFSNSFYATCLAAFVSAGFSNLRRSSDKDFSLISLSLVFMRESLLARLGLLPLVPSGELN